MIQEALDEGFEGFYFFRNKPYFGMILKVSIFKNSSMYNFTRLQ